MRRRCALNPLFPILPRQESAFLAHSLPLSVPRSIPLAGRVGLGRATRPSPLLSHPLRGGVRLWHGRPVGWVALSASTPSSVCTCRSLSSSVVCGQGAKEAEIVSEAQAAAQAEPPKKDVLIEETETLTGQPERLDFQSETAKLLDIVAHSLYTDKEVFVRELISNASDALEKLRHMQLSDAEIKDKYLNLEIHISTDEKNKTIIIQDFGVGMTRDELVKNLGTIAHSGTQEYLRNLDGKDSNIIGQFGVGFYSAFMVGSQVKVYSLSAQPGAKGYCWASEGTGSYTLTEAEGVSRGTKIVIKLRDGAEHFSKKQTIENIIKKYSNFVGFPIKLNGERINTIKPLWTMPKGVITEEEHKEFYQFLAHTYDQPMYHLHFTSDSPFSIQSIFYVPEQHQEKYGMGRMEPGVNLFSRKVLVKPKMKTLLPDWLRFIKGVVDCEDISLHLSREHFQDSDLIKRLGNVLTARILKFIQEEASKDPTRYNQKFWREFGTFLKEGICTDAKWKDELATLLRCESSRVEEGELVSLEDYVKRMPEEQNTIYYLCVPNRAFAESSPYYEGFKKRNLEVLFLYTSMDDFVMQNLGEFSGKRILSVESAQLPGELSKPGAEEDDIKDKQLGAKDVEDFAKWMKTALIDRVSSIKETDRLVSSPAIVVDHESASFRRMMKFVDPTRAPKLPKQRLEINPSHPIIIKLNKIRSGKPMLAKTIAEQVFDDALIAAGLMDDARAMLPRLNNILEAALDSTPAEATETKKSAPSTEPATD